MKKEYKYTGVGSLVGLASALALRKLVAADKGIDWKDYATWGAVGAGLGGTLGYGLATTDTDSYSPEQKEHVQQSVDGLEKDIKDLQKADVKPGLFNVLGAGTMTGAISGVTNWWLAKALDGGESWTKRIDKVRDANKTWDEAYLKAVEEIEKIKKNKKSNFRLKLAERRAEQAKKLSKIMFKHNYKLYGPTAAMKVARYFRWGSGLAPLAGIGLDIGLKGVPSFSEGIYNEDYAKLLDKQSELAEELKNIKIVNN